MAQKVSAQDFADWKIQRGASTRTLRQGACRYLLSVIVERHPGHAVELRIPLAGAVQILSGVNHRRGTPPAVVEMNMDTFLMLSVGELEWDQATENGLVTWSGERSNLEWLFPIAVSDQ